MQKIHTDNLTLSNVKAHTDCGSSGSDELQTLLNCKLNENEKLKIIIKKLKNEMQLLNILKNSNNINLIIEKLDKNNKLNELNDTIDLQLLKKLNNDQHQHHHQCYSHNNHRHGSSKGNVSHHYNNHHSNNHNHHNHHSHQNNKPHICMDEDEGNSQNSNSPSPSLSLSISNTSTDSHYNNLLQLSPISVVTNELPSMGDNHKQFDDVFVSYLNTNVHYDQNTLKKLLSGASTESTTNASVSGGTAATSPMSSSGSVNCPDVSSKCTSNDVSIAGSFAVIPKTSMPTSSNEVKKDKKKSTIKQKRQHQPKQVYIYPDGTKTTLTLSGKPRKKYNTKKRREAAAAAAAAAEREKKEKQNIANKLLLDSTMSIDPLDIIPKITGELSLTDGNSTKSNKKTLRSNKNKSNNHNKNSRSMCSSNDLNLSTMKKELSSINEEDFANLLLKGILENDSDIIANADNLLGADIFGKTGNKNYVDSFSEGNKSESLTKGTVNDETTPDAGVSATDFNLDEDYDLDIEEDNILNSLKLNRSYSLA